MRAQRIDPRVSGAWESDPIHDFRVIFWPSATHADEYEVHDAEDVHAAIAWANDEAARRGCTYTLFAKLERGDDAGLVWLAGINPTSTSGPNFSLARP
jgi:hypothetical protein